ncbi:hypothetical protein niasHT_024344 [Heterodera trifolii]|uniref:Amiloride-sensitive sodium channel n=1 Tax=Heterodera trifolii TaxID=157864 RepID=A0ABD2JMH8_9BILA
MSVKPFQKLQPPKIIVSDEQNERILTSIDSVISRQNKKAKACAAKEQSQRRIRKDPNDPTLSQNLFPTDGMPMHCGTTKSKMIKSRASELIIRIPSRQLKRIVKTQGIRSLQRETQHFVGVTSVNGLLRVYRSRGVFRLFWVTVTTVSLLLLFWQITKLVQLYFSRPTASQISFLLNDNGLPFPAVTICSHRPIRAQYVESIMKAMNISHRLLEYLMLSFMDVQQLISVSDEDELRLADQEWKEFTHFLEPKFTVNGFFWNASATCQQMLKLCSFGGRDFDCCKYAKGILTDIGKCYQLDLSSTDQLWLNRQVQFGMNNNGLQIIVDTHTEQQIDSIVLDNGHHPFAGDTFDSGFRYFVHEKFSMPYLSTEGISVSPGIKVFSAISPTHYILLPHEMWGNCSDQWPEDLQEIVNDGAADERYSSLKCKTLCRAKYFNELCGCSPFSYNIDEFFSVCTPYEIYKCLGSTVLNDTKLSQNEQILPNCPQCKIECQRWVYHTYNSYTEAFARKPKDKWRRKAEQWSTIASLNIFYRDMAYTEYKQVQSLSMTEILSDIGGNMGLFLGMSLISLIEFITYICKISWLFFSKKRRDHMLAKQRIDEQRQKQMEITLENAVPTSQFDTLFGRISRSIKRKTARDEKSIFVLPSNNRKQSDAELGIPSIQRLNLEGHTNGGLKRSQSMLSTFFESKKAQSSKLSNDSRSRNLVDSIIESRLHGNAGRAARRSSISSSSSGETEEEHQQKEEGKEKKGDKLGGKASAERKEVELKIDLDSKTVMLVGPPHGGRRYSTTAVLSYHSPAKPKLAKSVGKEV